MRAALAAVLIAGLAGCGPEAPPPRVYVTFLAEDQAAADVMAPYFPSVEATYGVHTRVEIGAVLGGKNAPRQRHAGGTATPCNADQILDRIQSRVRADDTALVALTWARVCVGEGETTEQVYGRGRRHQRTAVVGLGAFTPALRQAGDTAGLKGERDWAPLRARVLLHETGHALGRPHCDDIWCLMAEANGPSELGRVALVPCEACLASYAAIHALKPATLRDAAAKAAAVHGWSIEPPTKNAAGAERTE